MEYRTRPEITEEKVAQICSVIRDNPEWNRSRISQHICRMWRWQAPNGRLKDISCRDLLRELDRVGKIKLPAPQMASGGAPNVIRHIEHDTTPVIGKLPEFRPLRIENVSSGKDLTTFKSYIDQYHYLGFNRTVGANMKYMVFSRDGKPLSGLLFGSAAWSCRERDTYIGWNKEERKGKLSYLTNNTRFLIFPWVRVPHLASHILSLVTRMVSADWQFKYGHPLYCLETFVERDRFRGTSYQAANWICVGSTTGRGRDGGHKNAISPIKDIYLYPLKNFRELTKEGIYEVRSAN